MLLGCILIVIVLFAIDLGKVVREGGKFGVWRGASNVKVQVVLKASFIGVLTTAQASVLALGSVL